MDEGLKISASPRFLSKDDHQKWLQLGKKLKECKEKGDRETYEKLLPEYQELNGKVANHAFFVWMCSGLREARPATPTFADVMLEAAKKLDKREEK